MRQREKWGKWREEWPEWEEIKAGRGGIRSRLSSAGGREGAVGVSHMWDAKSREKDRKKLTAHEGVITVVDGVGATRALQRSFSAAAGRVAQWLKDWCHGE